MSKIKVFRLLLISSLCAFAIVGLSFINYSEFLTLKTEDYNNEISTLHNDNEYMNEKVSTMGISIQNNIDDFEEQSKKLAAINNSIVTRKNLEARIIENNILKALGPSQGTYIDDDSQVRIFNFIGGDYRGYIAKVKLFNPEVFNVVVANDTKGTLETTSSAAKRKNAVLAINGGGFYYKITNKGYIPVMIGYTVVDGKLVNPFYKNPGHVFFAGIDKDGQVVGGVPKSLEELNKLNPYEGVSFIPQLLKNGKKLTIPTEWKNQKHPRTVIGKFSNGDLMMLVVDGRRPGWSNGITLEELQNKLLQLGVTDAYNLDGGGSSAMYYKGKILNKPSGGKERPVVNNIVILP